MLEVRCDSREALENGLECDEIYQVFEKRINYDARRVPNLVPTTLVVLGVLAAGNERSEGKTLWIVLELSGENGGDLLEWRVLTAREASGQEKELFQKYF